MKKEIEELVRKWLKKADKDILTAERELTFDEPVLDSVCFHSQQAVEKYLKAFLILHQIYFNKTHSIINLLELCSQVDKEFIKELSEADKLTDYAVEIRYPDNWLEPDINAAEESIKIAKKVKDFVLKRLQLNEKK